MSAQHSDFKIFSFTGKTKILHLTWFAFFISFFVWFNQNGLLLQIQTALGLTDEEYKSLLILNVLLTIPARVLVGSLVDKFGPRLTYSALLALSSIPCLIYALADDFTQLAIARLMMGFVGAGFVIGIRLIGEWFPAKQAGLAEGIYGGWGNFGNAAATILLPIMAIHFFGDDGWRYAIGFTGLVALGYSFVYFKMVTDTPKGSTYFKPNKAGAMEVTCKADMTLYMLMTFPLYGALAVTSWRLTTPSYGIISTSVASIIYVVLATLYLYNIYKIISINKEVLSKPIPDIHKYKFKQVAILNLCYMVTFGSEIAAVMILAISLKAIFSVSDIMATFGAGCFVFMNILARPLGGHLSDKIGRKKTLIYIFCGIIVGYFVMSSFSSGWAFGAAILVLIITSSFVQAGSGAVFGMVPLIKRRMTGQIAGLTGAYGNVGAVLYLTIFTFVSAQTLFLIIALFATFVLLMIIFFLDEPKGQMAEILPDGTVQMIDVE